MYLKRALENRSRRSAATKAGIVRAGSLLCARGVWGSPPNARPYSYPLFTRAYLLVIILRHFIGGTPPKPPATLHPPPRLYGFGLSMMVDF